MKAITREIMKEAGKIASHLRGTAKDKQRRGELLEDLLAEYGRGPEGVKDKLACRLGVLDGEFAKQLDELKKLL